jgi:hypothetical protein
MAEEAEALLKEEEEEERPMLVRGTSTSSLSRIIHRPWTA